MPTLVLGTAAMPAFMRLTRAGMIEALASDYVRTARAKGLLWRSVLFKHALRNAMLPVVTVAAVQLGFMLSGSVVVETVFSLNGLGFLAWQSLSVADLPMIQAIVLLASLTYVVLTTLADVLNALLDPRLRPA
jgi:peptide/nickel transport system permease protein